MSLARRFNAGNPVVAISRRVATIEFPSVSDVATRREDFVHLVPALKGRAKFSSTLRVERTCSELPEVCSTFSELSPASSRKMA
jgi:hypothetical protein